MNKPILTMSVLLLTCLISCSPGKKKLRDEFTRSCIVEADKETSDTKVRRYLHDYCECAGDKAAEKFSAEELNEFNQMKLQGKEAEIQAKLMPVIQSCQEELRSKIMADSTIEP